MGVAIAHTAGDGTRLQPLEEHLEAVGRLAGGFASAFCDPVWGEAAGRWHDLGKYSAIFQAMIRAASGLDEYGEDPTIPGRVDHSTAGAVHAYERPIPQPFWVTWTVKLSPGMQKTG